MLSDDRERSSQALRWTDAILRRGNICARTAKGEPQKVRPANTFQAV